MRKGLSISRESKRWGKSGGWSSIPVRKLNAIGRNRSDRGSQQ
jgi:hypothetical protein